MATCREIVNKFITDFEVVHEFVEIPEGLNPEIAKLLGEIFYLEFSLDERAKELRRAELVNAILGYARSADAYAKMCIFSDAVDGFLSRIESAQSLIDGTEDGKSEYEFEMQKVFESANLDELLMEVVVQLK